MLPHSLLRGFVPALTEQPAPVALLQPLDQSHRFWWLRWYLLLDGGFPI
jgi:hypothetical protein